MATAVSFEIGLHNSTLDGRTVWVAGVAPQSSLNRRRKPPRHMGQRAGRLARPALE